MPALLLAMAPLSAIAHEPLSLPEIGVTGEAAGPTSLGDAVDQQPVDSSVIDREAIERQAANNVVDLFRTTPGVTVRSLGQGAIGDDLGIRGFTGGHSTDVAIQIDGVPVNQPNGRAHGLGDIGWLVPAMIERIEVIKGPFSAAYGNFAQAGVINIITRTDAEHDRVRLAGGRFARLEGTLTLDGGGPFGVLHAGDSDGFRNNQFEEHFSAFGNHVTHLGEGHLRIQAHASRRDFGAPGYLPLADLQAGRIDREAAFNPTDGGRSDVYGASLHFDSERWQSLLYVGGDDRSRFASFSPTQNVDFTDATYAGWRIIRRFQADPAWFWRVGTDGRFDDGERTRFATDGQRGLMNLVRSRDSESLNAGVFAEAQWQALPSVKLTAGLRADSAYTSVDNRFNPAADGSGDTTIVTPRFGAAWQPLYGVELFANHGTGFRSPSAEELSPDTGVYRQLEHVELESTDIGLRWFRGPWRASASAFITDAAGEIRETAPGEFVNIGATERDGFEVELRYDSGAWQAYLTSTHLDARQQDGGGDVTGVPENQQTAGVSWRHKRWTTDIYAQRYGETPLTADAAITRDAIITVGSRIAYGPPRWRVFAQAFWRPDPLLSESAFGFGGGVVDPKPRIDALAGVEFRL
ncbi:TonB-dependent receptor [Salinisphaera sp. P385]|uniref:TonB-dependent receptor n=1 Tax=Spectribacter acetivorans TaxID=3075603 RepID=A0ABU3BAQ0_9GAMM|nr:TonB-dependent receptor [Salinisphaera sp. P385]MDT0618046.1 TonB-dependent receptor [Salinisphaera sp. P385]